VDETARKARAKAIEQFAALLGAVREAAGKPSFRVMAGRSAVISHTTLHEAVHGSRLPSWETTVEFLRACDADPQEYRQRWERARDVACAAARGRARQAGARAGRPATGAIPATTAPAPVQHVDASVEVAGDVQQCERPAEPVECHDHGTGGGLASPMAAVDPTPVGPTPADRPRRGRRGWAVGAAVAAVLVAGTAAAGWARAGDSVPSAEARPRTPADCPVHPPNPPAAPARHEGDRASFVADATLPDCSHVTAGQRVVKVWRLKNAGEVAWVGYTVHRLDVPQARDECQTIPDVPVPDTQPGRMVDIEVQVSVPAKAGFCFVRFKMVDAAGNVAFPGSRPLNFQLVVD
jgi:hypothetical protein